MFVRVLLSYCHSCCLFLSTCSLLYAFLCNSASSILRCMLVFSASAHLITKLIQLAEFIIGLVELLNFSVPWKECSWLARIRCILLAKSAMAGLSHHTRVVPRKLGCQSISLQLVIGVNVQIKSQEYIRDGKIWIIDRQDNCPKEQR